MSDELDDIRSKECAVCQRTYSRAELVEVRWSDDPDDKIGVKEEVCQTCRDHLEDEQNLIEG